MLFRKINEIGIVYAKLEIRTLCKKHLVLYLAYCLVAFSLHFSMKLIKCFTQKKNFTLKITKNKVKWSRIFLNENWLFHFTNIIRLFTCSLCTYQCVSTILIIINFPPAGIQNTNPEISTIIQNNTTTCRFHVDLGSTYFLITKEKVE